MCSALRLGSLSFRAAYARGGRGLLVSYVFHTHVRHSFTFNRSLGLTAVSHSPSGIPCVGAVSVPVAPCPQLARTGAFSAVFNLYQSLCSDPHATQARRQFRSCPVFNGKGSLRQLLADFSRSRFQFFTVRGLSFLGHTLSHRSPRLSPLSSTYPANSHAIKTSPSQGFVFFVGSSRDPLFRLSAQNDSLLLEGECSLLPFRPFLYRVASLGLADHKANLFALLVSSRGLSASSSSGVKTIPEERVQQAHLGRRPRDVA